jgi:chromosome segregation ATPase
MAHAPLSPVRIELRNGSARPVTYDVTGDEFVVGSVAGCDLRLAGANLPPVLCVIARSADGPRLRKLAPALPLLLNGRPVQTANLRAGDTISLGDISLIMQIDAAALQSVEFMPIGTPVADVPGSPVAHRPGPDLQEADLAERRRKLDQQVAEMEADRVRWYRRRDELEKECREREQAIESEQRRREELYKDAAAAVEVRLAECDKREQYLAEKESRHHSEWEKIERHRAELEQRGQDIASHEELEKLREELTSTRRDLHQRYQERRDRIAGLHQAVQVAAKRVQDDKRELTGREQTIAPRLADLEARRADLDRRELELATAAEEAERARQEIEARQAEVAAKLQEATEKLEAQQAECDLRDQQLAANEERYRGDLARLDRFQDTVEQRERQSLAGAAEVERQREQLQRDMLEMEEQARQLDSAQTLHLAEEERLKQQRIELEGAREKIAERSSMVEGQQAMLAALRTRLERLQGDVRQEATLLAEQRVRQEAMDRDLQAKAIAAEQLRASVECESLAHAAERQIFESRSSELQTAVTRLKELQERLSAEATALNERRTRLDAQAKEQSAQTAELKGRAVQLLELQEKLNADRAAVKEREATLARDEEARKALQEQLRRRAEDLAARQKQLDEQSRTFEERIGQVGAEFDVVGRQKEAADEALVTARQHLDQQIGAMQQMAERLSATEAELIRQYDRLKSVGRALAAGKKSHAKARASWAMDHQAGDADTIRLRAELDEYRRKTLAEANTLKQQLPDLELRGQAVLVRLGQAREELRGHLGELHDYTRQGQEDLESVQVRVRAEADRLREQEAAINRAKAEHRLAVTAFRQQLLEWQGRVADMRRVLADDGTRLEWKQAEVSAAAKQVDETAMQLARQAADLQEQERLVVARREEMERHLSDMREWYRRKLRELAAAGGSQRASGTGMKDGPPSIPMTAKPTSARSEPRTPIAEVLSMTDDVDPGDRQLGELLRSLELVDADTLTALLLEARRQRRSLRQVLLSARGGGTPLLTLYQLALIESGNLDALVLGPTRVIDRLQATAREAVYRVFDPRRAGDGQGTVLLRHLAEAEMQHAVHPDEFRQRFAAMAALDHPHLGKTLEVLEINGRPAALQEWLSGLPATDWPSMASIPGVWHWLVSQTAAGLHAAHQAGLVHGRLTARAIILTPSGLVKVTGCGEPPWLAGRLADATPTDDLDVLGELAAGWGQVSRRKATKPAKPLPDALQRILDRLRPDAIDRYPSAAQLLADLEAAGPTLPAMGDAWEEMLAFAKENATDGIAWRKSA